ncbi:hypothetical protein [Pseudorhodobacter sp.]|uniref:hypothetical protein n=1 Tax=Pseudorhodobacter sp. TaxID=1934400 RepID=UPI0026482253|nr:hypothetical protein [Pseudorhodobacter sp.]MDN5787647.1 hypothetical protein [Pseudorhodobacter sp.]
METKERGLSPAAIVAVLFGLLTIGAGGKALFGNVPVENAVPFVLWFNFIAGFAYVAAGFGLFWRQSWAVRLSIAIFVMTVLVTLAFFSPHGFWRRLRVADRRRDQPARWSGPSFSLLRCVHLRGFAKLRMIGMFDRSPPYQGEKAMLCPLPHGLAARKPLRTYRRDPERRERGDNSACASSAMGLAPCFGSLVAVAFPVAMSILQFGDLERMLFHSVLLTVAQMWVGDLSNQIWQDGVRPSARSSRLPLSRSGARSGDCRGRCR